MDSGFGHSTNRERRQNCISTCNFVVTSIISIRSQERVALITRVCEGNISFVLLMIHFKIGHPFHVGMSLPDFYIQPQGEEFH